MNAPPITEITSGWSRRCRALGVLWMLGLLHAPLALAVQSPQKLQASDGYAGQQFGCHVDVDGETAVIGTYEPFLSSPQGGAYVFTRSGGVWTEQAKLTSPNAQPTDAFGRSVGISGDTIVVGAFGDSTVAQWNGAVYVFTRQGGVWTEQAKLMASTTNAMQKFGLTVALDGDTLVVGASGDNWAGTETGAVYVFTRLGSSWSEQARLTATVGRAYDGFGSSVDVQGDMLAVGKPGGGVRAYVFVRSGETWTEQETFSGSGASAGVSLSGDTLAVGGTGDLPFGPGMVQVYARQAGVWSGQGAWAPGQWDASPAVVKGDLLVVGDQWHDLAAVDGGVTFDYLRTGSSWSSQGTRTASDAESGDHFGGSIAMSGDSLFVGAYLDDDQGQDAGSAYVYPVAKSCIVVHESFGSGLAGYRGYVPVLSGEGSSCDPGTRTVHIRDGLGKVPGFLLAFLGKGDLDYRGGKLYVDLSQYWYLKTIRLGGSPGVAGAGYLDLTVPVAATSLPYTFHLQAVLADPVGPQGVSITNGLTVRVEE